MSVVVIGGGPAGLATALSMRRRGLDVTVIDGRRPPIDKACGEGLMPDGVLLLEKLGVEIPRRRCYRFLGVRYLAQERSAAARFARGHGLGVRRPVLHVALAARAEAVGVRLLWGRKARGLTEAGVETDQGPLEAAWVVGADGLHSSVRKWAGMPARPGRVRRFGVRRHFSIAPWTDLVEVHWGEGCEAYVTPVAADEVGVALLWSGRKARFDNLLAQFPRLARRLRSAPVVSRDRGAGHLWQRPRRLVAGRVALVGDAAGYLDAITGEGMALAFQQAELLGEALEHGDLAGYERRARRVAAFPFALIRALLFIERHPVARRRLVRTLAAEPDLFARLLAIHARELPPRALGAVGALKLARGLAWG